MKRVILTIASVLAGSSSASAQYYDYDENEADTEGSDYEAFFGEGEEAPERAAGPTSIAEAKKLGKGYRIGRGAEGMHARPKRDVHVVQEGDTLWDISTHYFGDPWRWPQVWSYNPEVTNPHWIYPLDQIRLTEDTLKVDEAVARADTGGLKPGASEGSEGSGLKVIGDGSDENASSVQIEKHMLTPDTVFLRDVGYLDDEALPTVGQIIGGFEEQMFLTNSDQLYIKFEEEQDVRAGQQFTIFRSMHKYERTKKEKGELVRIFGTALIRSYDRDKRVARAVITEALDPIERGFKVAKLERRFDLVPPRRNEKDLEGKIVATIRPLDLLSHDNVVFLDVGAEQGVQAGNRFFVVRKGDNWLRTLERKNPEQMGNVVHVPAYDEEQFPEEVVAELRVVKVRKKTTVAVIVRSDLDVTVGERVQMRKGF